MKILLPFLFLFLSIIHSKDLFEDYSKQALKIMSKMTTEEKIGQLFFAHYSDIKPTEDIPKYKPGGIIFFSEDFNKDETTIKAEIDKMQSLSKKSIGLPLGLSVDEEGGDYNVVSKKHRAEGGFLSVQNIYKESGIDGLLKIEQEKRDLLRKFNLNINLGIVADISTNTDDFICSRTLGQNEEITADYILKDVEGYVNDKFTCCVKHFPGYGNNPEIKVDTVIDNRKFDVLYENDLKPFIKAINQKVPMILFSNIITTCKDSTYPVSFSKTWHDYIRKDLSFSGLILTEINMENINKYTNGKSPAVVAINAGNDIIFTNDFYNQFESVVQAVKSGDISEEIINTACKRIISWKLQYLDSEKINKNNLKINDNNSTIDEDDIEKINRYYSKSNSNNTSLVIVLCVVFGVVIIFAIIFIGRIYFKKKKVVPSEGHDSQYKLPVGKK